MVTLKKYNWIEENHAVWSAVDNNENIFTTTALILSQLAEISVHINNNASKEKLINELADIVSIACRQIERYGMSVNDAMKNRIETRYRERIDDIIEKYRRLLK